MAEKENINQPKALIEATPEEMKKLDKTFEEKRDSGRLDAWNPKTQIGRDVKSGKEKDIDHILKNRNKILEPEIVEMLIPIETDLLAIGQAKGKFGGGKRRAWRQTQKKTMEGNVVTFSAMAVVGDRNGHVGIGTGKAKETLPAREKALRAAKLNVIRVERGCGNFDCSCNQMHSLAVSVEGKCGSVRVKLLPAPQGTGLVVGNELKKILKLAGIKDIYGITKGQVRTTINAGKACMDALSKTTEIKR
ncbi:MAG: 30S ribosomal protein S5 [Nanoarchaeota archaeon]